jgi:integrase
MPRLTPAAVLKLKSGKSRREIADGGSPGLYLVIQTSGTKSFAMRYRSPHGRAVKLTLGPLDLSGRKADEIPIIGQPLSLVAARRLGAEVHRQRALGHDVAATLHREKLERDAGLSKTFDGTSLDFTEQYLKSHVKHWQRAARLIGVGVDAEGALFVMPKGLADRWRDKPLTAITADDLHFIIDEVRERGVPGLKRHGARQSEAMAHQMYSVLRKMFNWLAGKRRIKVNPCKDLIGPKPSGKSRDRFLNDAEIVKFWRACDQIDEPARQVLRLLILTGARLNEIAMLLRGEVADNIITIPAARSKNKLPHVIPLPPSALSILRSVKTSGDFYFVGKSGRPIGPWSRIKRKLDAHMKPDTPYVLHDLRRSVATGMNEIGIQPHIVEAVLNHISGHKSGVAGTYNRAVYLKEKTSALARWSDHISGLIEGRTSTVVAIKRRT